MANGLSGSASRATRATGRAMGAAMQRFTSAVGAQFSRFQKFYERGFKTLYIALGADYIHAIEKPQSLSTAEKVWHYSIGFTWLAAGITAFILHQAYSIGFAFRHTLNAFFIDAKAPFHNVRDDRGVAPKLLGGLSFFVGGLVGAFVGTVYANLVAIPYTVALMFNVAFNEKFSAGYPSNVHTTARHGWGLVGTSIGFAIGLIPFSLIASGRILYHSLESAFKSIVVSISLVYLLLVKDTEIVKREMKSFHKNIMLKDRTNLRAYGFGAPGIIASVPFLVLSFVVGFLIGTVKEFRKSSLFVFATLFNATAAKKSELTIDSMPAQEELKNQQTFVQRYVFGAIPTLLGLSVGLIAAVGNVLIRTAINSFRLFMDMVESGIIMGLGDRYYRDFGFNKKNTTLNHIGFGIPGLIVGAVVGLLAIIIFRLRHLSLLLTPIALILTAVFVRGPHELYKLATHGFRFSDKNQVENKAMEKKFYSLFAAMDPIDSTLDVNSPNLDLTGETVVLSATYTKGLAAAIRFISKSALLNQKDGDEILLCAIHDFWRSLNGGKPLQATNSGFNQWLTDNKRAPNTLESGIKAAVDFYIDTVVKSGLTVPVLMQWLVDETYQDKCDEVEHIVSLAKKLKESLVEKTEQSTTLTQWEEVFSEEKLSSLPVLARVVTHKSVEGTVATPEKALPPYEAYRNERNLCFYQPIGVERTSEGYAANNVEPACSANG